MASSSQAENVRVRKPLTQERPKELLHYDPDTGIWTRINGGRKGSKLGRAGCLKKHGYRTIDVDGFRRYEHQLAVLYVEGWLPDNSVRIDHADTVRDHNWWDNIRVATPTLNCANRRMNYTNSVGFKCVSRHPDPRRSKPYSAHIKINRKAIHLGWFYTPEEAHAAYCTAATEVHGEFARFG